MPRPRFTPALALLPLLAAAAGADDLGPREKGDRAIAARQVLFKYCRECHGGDTSAGRLTVVDHNRLVDPGPVPVPFASRNKDRPRSQVVEFMRDGSMPPGGRPTGRSCGTSPWPSWPTNPTPPGRSPRPS